MIHSRTLGPRSKSVEFHHHNRTTWSNLEHGSGATLKESGMWSTGGDKREGGLSTRARTHALVHTHSCTRARAHTHTPVSMSAA